ncbi:MAG TPA: TerC/Alx family metal homeostasis membrane protein [Blastocatellia bacterium]|nr:TerC/Alx family metal homeostasis membrane protein [Blastocatellia bacterium]
MGSFSFWGGITLGLVALVLLLVDLFANRRKDAESSRGSLVWSGLWVGLGLGFNLFVWLSHGPQAAQEYLAAYLIEISLSVDNLFVFLVIFRTLKIPQRHQHSVLFWGIFGALVFRGLFIIAGVQALDRWAWGSYLLAAVLFYAAVQAFREDPTEERENRVIVWLERHLPVTRELQGPGFIAVRDGRRVATPLLIALIGIELTDIMFAVDSVPAALSVSRELFIIYSSNVLAILGLRSFYLVLARSLARLKYLHYGLAGVLAFTSIKLMLDQWIRIPPLVSVGIIALMIGAAAWASLRARRERENLAKPKWEQYRER